jgi:hypothetical protein
VVRAILLATVTPAGQVPPLPDVSPEPPPPGATGPGTASAGQEDSSRKSPPSPARSRSPTPEAARAILEEADETTEKPVEY